MTVSLADVINELLDEVCQKENLTEQELAKSKGVSRVTLWRWRQGEAGKAAEILIPLLLNKCKRLQTDTQ